MLTNKKIEQAIKYYENLKNYAKQWESEYPDQPQALDMADVAIESLESLCWRNPEKELPKPDKLVILHIGSLDYEPYALGHMEYLDGQSYEYVDVDGNVYEEYEIDGWLPLPEWREEE